MKKLFSKLNLGWLLLVLASYGTVSLLIYYGIIDDYYEITLAGIMINIILAVSLNLIIGITGQFSLGHAGFMCIGGYAAGIILKSLPNYYGLLLALVAGIVVSAIVSLIIAAPTLRLRGDYLAIATLGFAEIIRIVVLNMKITNGAAGIFGIVKLVNWTVLFCGALLTIVVVVNFSRSALGRACISVREDETAAEAMGINTTRAKVMAFVVGAALASVAGVFYASYYYVVKPEIFGFSRSIDILVMVVFGGMGSITGSVLACFGLGIVNMLLQSFAEFRMVFYAVLLVVIMIFRPQGLLGTKEFTLSGLGKKQKTAEEDES